MPDVLCSYRKIQEFLRPCCLCPLLGTGREIKHQFMEAAIHILVFGCYIGEYVAEGVKSRCGYLGLCYDFSYFVLFTFVFSLFLEVSHGAAALTHFSLTHIAATLLTHCTAVVLAHSIAILIALPHWCSIYSGQSCRLFFS